jgi:hypothetical protein
MEYPADMDDGGMQWYEQTGRQEQFEHEERERKHASCRNLKYTVRRSAAPNFALACPALREAEKPIRH